MDEETGQNSEEQHSLMSDSELKDVTIEPKDKDSAVSAIHPGMSIGPKYKAAKRERFIFLTLFFFFNVVLLASDIFTDILRGFDLILSGDLKYGFATISLIFVPMLAEMFLHLAKSGIHCSLSREDFKRPRLFLSKPKIKNFFWSFPMLQPVRNLRFFVALTLYDTSVSSNHHAIARIKRIASRNSMLESFLESAPQLLLQFYFIAHEDNTEDINLIQVFSIATSFLSLAMTSTRHFFSQRLGVFSDADPTIKMILSVLPVVGVHLGMLLYSYFVIVQSCKAFFWIPILVTMFCQFFLVNMVNSGPKRRAIIEKVYNNCQEQAVGEIRQLQLIAVLTSWISPFSVWVNTKLLKTNFLLYTSMIPITVNILVYTAASIHFEAPILNLRNFNKKFYHLIVFEILSAMTACLLHYLSNYSCLTNFSRKVGLMSPRLFNNVFKDNIVEFCLDTRGSKTEAEMKKLHQGFLDNIDYDYHKSAQQSLYSLQSLLGQTESFKDLKQFYSCYVIIRTKEDKTWGYQLPPMHQAAIEGNWLKWCFLNFLGGESGALNGLDMSSLGFIIREIEEQDEGSEDLSTKVSKLQSYTCLTRWWLKRFIKGYDQNKLHDAATRGDIQTIESLLDDGFDINTVNKDNKTALVIAIENDQPDVLKLLLNNEAEDPTSILTAVTNNNPVCLDLLLKSSNFWFMSEKASDTLSPFHVAAAHNYAECLKVLIDADSRIDVTNNSGETPLHLAAGNGCLECLKLLIANRADMKAETLFSETPLYRAAIDGQVACLTYLIEKGADVNQTGGYYGIGPLHGAARNGQVECLKILIGQGGKVNARVNFSLTPLHEAADAGQTECIQILLDHGADIEAEDGSGYRPVHKAVAKGHVEALQTLIRNGADLKRRPQGPQAPLHIAAALESSECLKILLAKTSDVNVTYKDGVTPLHEAAIHNRPENLIILLDSGADIGLANSEGNQAIHFAAESGSLECLKVLVEKFDNVNAVNEELKTALHFAASIAHYDCLKHLIEAGVEVNAKDTHGKTALSYVEERKKDESDEAVIKLLKEYGATH